MTTETRPGDAPTGGELSAEERIKIEQGRQNAEVVLFLLTHLFGWKEVVMVTARGRERTCADGEVRPVKGYYGIPPGKSIAELFPYHIASQEEPSRRVIAAMEERGYSYCAIKCPGIKWRVSFIINGKDGISGHFESDREAFAVCKAAEAALKEEALRRLRQDSQKPVTGRRKRQ